LLTEGQAAADRMCVPGRFASAAAVVQQKQSASRDGLKRVPNLAGIYFVQVRQMTFDALPISKRLSFGE
jgi:hypothetical protein